MSKKIDRRLEVLDLFSKQQTLKRDEIFSLGLDQVDQAGINEQQTLKRDKIFFTWTTHLDQRTLLKAANAQTR